MKDIALLTDVTAKACSELVDEAEKNCKTWLLKRLEDGYKRLLTAIVEESKCGARYKWVKVQSSCDTYFDRTQTRFVKREFKVRLRKQGFKCSWFGDGYYDFWVKW